MDSDVRYIALFVFCMLVAGGSYYMGARNERINTDTIRAEYVAAVSAYDLRLAELRRSMDESQGRIDSIGRGLGEAVDLASKSPDRSRRIALLVAGIESALAVIRSEP